MPDDPFRLDLTGGPDWVRLTHSLRPAALAATRPLLDWVFALRTFRRLHARAAALQEGSFAERALRTLDIEVESTGDLSSVPARGTR
jgi:hypothetical protein